MESFTKNYSLGGGHGGHKRSLIPKTGRLDAILRNRSERKGESLSFVSDHLPQSNTQRERESQVTAWESQLSADLLAAPYSGSTVTETNKLSQNDKAQKKTFDECLLASFHEEVMNTLESIQDGRATSDALVKSMITQVTNAIEAADARAERRIDDMATLLERRMELKLREATTSMRREITKVVSESLSEAVRRPVSPPSATLNERSLAAVAVQEQRNAHCTGPTPSRSAGLGASGYSRHPEEYRPTPSRSAPLSASGHSRHAEEYRPSPPRTGARSASKSSSARVYDAENGSKRSRGRSSGTREEVEALDRRSSRDVRDLSPPPARYPATTSPDASTLTVEDYLKARSASELKRKRESQVENKASAPQNDDTGGEDSMFCTMWPHS